VLVAALSYPEADYDFAAYHMGGVVKDLEIRNLPPGGAAAAVVRVRDEDISFSLNRRRDEWIFPDFERIGGIQIHTPSIDNQGIGRLARAVRLASITSECEVVSRRNRLKARSALRP
jgi:hypothetical protein